MKGLFVTHEGIGNSIFRSQVLEHCADMRNFGINFDILVYNGYPRLWETSVQNLVKYKNDFNLTIRLHRALFIWFPFSFIFNSLLFYFYLAQNKNKYNFIHARTDYSAFVCFLLKPIHRLPVIWDCRGDSVDEIKLAVYRRGTFFSFLAFYFIASQKFFVCLNKRFSKFNIFVSEALKELILGDIIKSNSIVIPCPVQEKYFYYSSNSRHRIREELGILSGEMLFVYSGSMAGYQAIDLLVIFFNKIISKRHKLLILTTEIEVFNTLHRHKFDVDSVIVYSVPYDVITEYYSASDFGILFREERSTNWVASPTKFGEYCLAGLKVIHNGNVQQIIQFTAMLGNGIFCNSVDFTEMPYSDRKKVAEQSKLVFGRENANKVYLTYYKSILNNE